MLVIPLSKPGVTAIVLSQHTPDARQKLQILAGMPAGDDILSRALYGRSKDDFRLPYPDPKKDPLPGVQRASVPNGKSSTLLGFRASLRCHSLGHPPPMCCKARRMRSSTVRSWDFSRSFTARRASGAE